jgi:hypothetical protein
VTKEYRFEQRFRVKGPQWAAKPLVWLMKRLGANHLTSTTLAGPKEEWKLEKRVDLTEERP